MTRVVRPAPSKIERFDTVAPAPAGDFRGADRTAIFKEEQMRMVNFAGRDVFMAERQVAFKDFERTRTKLNVAIFLRLGAVFIPPQDTCLGDRQHRSTGVVIRHEQSDLLRGT